MRHTHSRKGEGSMWKNVPGWRGPKLVSALAVFVVGMLGGRALTAAVHETTVFSQDAITATTLATEKLESLKALGFQRLLPTHTTSHKDSHLMAAFPGFRRQTAIAMDTPDIGMKTVTVTVWWNGHANAVRMSLILAE